MTAGRRPSVGELFRTEPLLTTLLAVGPLALAVGQLANGYVNDLSPIVTLPFAVVMIAFAAVATAHRAARYRRLRLEADLEG